MNMQPNSSSNNLNVNEGRKSEDTKGERGTAPSSKSTQSGSSIFSLVSKSELKGGKQNVQDFLKGIEVKLKAEESVLSDLNSENLSGEDLARLKNRLESVIGEAKSDIVVLGKLLDAFTESYNSLKKACEKASTEIPAKTTSIYEKLESDIRSKMERLFERKDLLDARMTKINSKF
jgi:hypothetical protein